MQQDFHGPIEGQNQKRWILVGVDRFSKWLVASVVGGVTSRIAITFMEDYIATYGVPEKKQSPTKTQPLPERNSDNFAET